MQCVGQKDGVAMEDNALLSEEQAVFLYSLRSKQTCADKPDLQAAAGRSAVVSEMFGVRTSIVRALWARYYCVREIEFVILVTARSCAKQRANVFARTVLRVWRAYFTRLGSPPQTNNGDDNSAILDRARNPEARV